MNTRVLSSNSTWSLQESNPPSYSNNIVKLLNPGPARRKENNIIKNVDRLSFKTVKIIGGHGLKRFNDFKKYIDGWDFGSGCQLSFRSVAVMESFISLYDNFKNQPSIFLTRNGNLQLGWEDRNGKTVEIEFFPNYIEYYSEAKKIESMSHISKDSLKELISELD